MSLKTVRACAIFHASGEMPRNCCVLLCSTNAAEDPLVRYDEFLSDECRAWLRNISREGPGWKGTISQPNDRFLVCALHFTEEDYKKTTKLRVLLPTAVPTVFPAYPSYMSTRRTPAPRKQWLRFKMKDNLQPCAECSGNVSSQDRLAISQNHSVSDTILVNSQPGAETCMEIASFTDASCQTTLDIDDLTKLKKNNAPLQSENHSYKCSTTGVSREIERG